MSLDLPIDEIQKRRILERVEDQASKFRTGVENSAYGFDAQERTELSNLLRGLLPEIDSLISAIVEARVQVQDYVFRTRMQIIEEDQLPNQLPDPPPEKSQGQSQG